MIKLFGAAVPARDWAYYCQLTPIEQLVLEERSDDLTKSILLLMNSKNNNAKKDLCLANSQGNLTAYPPTIRAIARFLSAQSSNKNSAYQYKNKEGG